MLRSALTASSRALLRLAAASSRLSSLHSSIALTSSVAPIRPLLPSVSVLRFPYDFSRGYARGKQAVSSRDDDDDEDDDFSGFDDSDDASFDDEDIVDVDDDDDDDDDEDSD
ncbi:hypothetical protein H6P81_014224 [Aristolochia fimbriata]|uniref:Uncharacterized protein n=1 Tax=Aristolochia fimbriata TaxID=158543 RepID=A0AAV7EK79_ARIFI|nr:hypothetical protein H6P81_014224 [Aristolochia fimbriata]